MSDSLHILYVHVLSILDYKLVFLARLHFRAEELLLYPRRPQGVGVRIQNVRANVKVMKFQSLCIFSCILTLLIIQIKPLTTKAHDRRASSDCGTSGFFFLGGGGGVLKCKGDL